MAKESIINLELLRYEEKVKEFQDYLEKNTIITKVQNGKLKEADENNRHKEIDTQIKIMNNLVNWLASLEKLRTAEEAKKFEARGDVEVNGLFANRK